MGSKLSSPGGFFANADFESLPGLLANCRGTI